MDNDHIILISGIGATLLVSIAVLVLLVVQSNALQTEHAALTAEQKVLTGKISNVEESYKILLTKVEELSKQGVGSSSGSAMEAENVFKNNQNIQLVSPNGGERFCLNGDEIIEWRAPADMESVQVGVEGNGFIGIIGTFPASLSESGIAGEGRIAWKGGELQDKGIAPEGLAYKLNISGEYRGKMIGDESDSIFALNNCEG